MHRSLVVYIGMIVVLVAGMWATLAAGGRLSAPVDLSGNWVVKNGPVKSIHVDQSGLYFQLKFDGGPPVPLRSDGSLSLDRGPWHVRFAPDLKSVSVNGPGLSFTSPASRPGI